jgi:hypothetical protein
MTELSVTGTVAASSLLRISVETAGNGGIPSGSRNSTYWM